MEERERERKQNKYKKDENNLLFHSLAFEDRISIIIVLCFLLFLLYTFFLHFYQNKKYVDIFGINNKKNIIFILSFQIEKNQ
jgi:hypothetical protein